MSSKVRQKEKKGERERVMREGDQVKVEPLVRDFRSQVLMLPMLDQSLY